MNNTDITKAAALLKTMANEKRLKILFHIADKELSVGEIEKLVNLSQSALSQHLAVFRAARIVKTRRKAQTIFYSLKDERLKEVLKLLERLFR